MALGGDPSSQHLQLGADRASGFLHLAGHAGIERDVHQPASDAALKAWLSELHGRSEDSVFATRTGRRLSPDAVQRWVTVHVQTAAANCPSLQDRKLSPHVFRHTNTMNLLHAGV